MLFRHTFQIKYAKKYFKKSKQKGKYLLKGLQWKPRKMKAAEHDWCMLITLMILLQAAYRMIAADSLNDLYPIQKQLYPKHFSFKEKVNLKLSSTSKLFE